MDRNRLPMPVANFKCARLCFMLVSLLVPTPVRCGRTRARSYCSTVGAEWASPQGRRDAPSDLCGFTPLGEPYTLQQNDAISAFTSWLSDNDVASTLESLALHPRLLARLVREFGWHLYRSGGGRIIVTYAR